MLLKGKNAVITGCLRGIGKTTMELFAENGANIWACCQEKNEEFEAHILELSSRHGVVITPVYFDLMDSEQIKKAMKSILGSKMSIDVLVNIAGMTFNSLFSMTSIEKMKQVFEIDFFSQMLITQYITKSMVKQKSGSVINISSVAAIDGNRGQVAYSSAKAAFIGATKTLAIELGDYGIRVNAIAPGVIQTDMTNELASKDLHILTEKTNFKRSGNPLEVANVLLFLASDLSSYMTGQVLRVDGGM
ncbi:SDR family oxidoreductase [Paenibacillus sp. EKM208P]|nr:SDR family oxidoreductase [Paenibacillus sp. EKM208P]